MSRRKNNRKTNFYKMIFSFIVLIVLVAFGYFNKNPVSTDTASANNISEQNTLFELPTIPEYSTTPYVEINNNIPYFTEKDYTTNVFEKYSELDENVRCGVAYANICKDTMPPDGDERGNISSVKPTGWVQNEYNGEYLYNRCHLIGYQLSDEDANKQNLITGTRYLNVEGMLPFENKVAEYIDNNEHNHVLYRVTPIFDGNNLLASGVQMEAWSVEDNGQGICFNVYCYNVQPGVVIDYSTGENHAAQVTIIKFKTYVTSV